MIDCKAANKEDDEEDDTTHNLVVAKIGRRGRMINIAATMMTLRCLRMQVSLVAVWALSCVRHTSRFTQTTPPIK